MVNTTNQYIYIYISILIFHISIIIPPNFHIFQRGWSTTNQIYSFLFYTYIYIHIRIINVIIIISIYSIESIFHISIESIYSIYPYIPYSISHIEIVDFPIKHGDLFQFVMWRRLNLAGCIESIAENLPGGFLQRLRDLHHDPFTTPGLTRVAWRFGVGKTWEKHGKHGKKHGKTWKKPASMLRSDEPNIGQMSPKIMDLPGFSQENRGFYG